jgi:hypothetical protein
MTQALYADMNNKKIKIKKKILWRVPLNPGRGLSWIGVLGSIPT